jgi:NDP-sugar pyrophosphorylase family protein
MKLKQAVVLAGGLGTRLRPITEKIPKPMVPVNDMPFLHWQLRDLKAQGFEKIILLTAYLGEQVEAYFGDGASYGLEISYSREPVPLGTGGALFYAREKLDDIFALVNGDSYLEAPIFKMAELLTKSQAKAIVSTFSRLSEVPVIANTQASLNSPSPVLKYIKDGGSQAGCQMIDSGVYIILKEVVLSVPKASRLTPEGPVFQLADWWPDLISAQMLYSYPVEARFYDIGTIERLREFESFVVTWPKELL